MRSGPPELLQACERALFEGARAHYPGSRQQLRAASRRFVRRHRREAAYLRRVLRALAASSALAVSLLGLSAAPASAKATLFAMQTGSANPLNGQDVGIYSKPAFGDLDADGDLDAISTENGGSFLYYENTGSATAPTYVQRTGSANPLDGFDVGGLTAPVLVDIDADGDLDIVTGAALGAFRLIRNTGNARAPAFTSIFGSGNPLNGQDIGVISVPTLGDLDGDGDLDIVAGEGAGGFFYFENTGTLAAPVYVLRTGTDNPLNGEDVGDESAPVLGDLDGDADLDLVVGSFGGGFRYYENTGNAIQPVFVLRPNAANPLAGASVGARTVPTLADVDADGDLDLFAGGPSGLFSYFRNLTGDFVARTGADNPFNGLTPLSFSTPTFADVDLDGDLDMFAGAHSGGISYYPNSGSATNPVYTTGSVVIPGGPFIYAKAAVADLDGDGDRDVMVGWSDGTFVFFRNTGTAASPVYTPNGGAANPMDLQDVGDASAPCFGDLDHDGDLDLLAGNYAGTVAYYKNTGTSSSPVFASQGNLPLSFGDLLVVPTLADVDGDGDLDLVTGGMSGVFHYFENTGTASAPSFEARSGTRNPFDGQDVGDASAPALADLDGDGDPDLVSGEQLGGFFTFENAIVRPTPDYFGPVPLPFGSADIGYFSSPAAGDLDGDNSIDFVVGETFGSGLFHYFKGAGPYAVEQTGSANPFDSVNSGGFPLPVFGDLDADGDLDLVAGDNYGAPLRFYRNTGTAAAPAFVQETGGANPLGNVIVGRSGPALGDLDGDGDLDLVVGEFLGNFHYFLNTGDARTPGFLELTGSSNPFNGLSVGLYGFSTAELGDMDHDGDLDLLAGDEPLGRFHYYENIGSANVPMFVERTGIDNPLDGKSVGLNSKPTFADLDRDGDLDVVSGERYGQFRTYYLPEPSVSLLQGAGVALVAWLDRWRRRQRRKR